eukprot:3967329-Prymnesium_polylepis.2
MARAALRWHKISDAEKDCAAHNAGILRWPNFARTRAPPDAQTPGQSRGRAQTLGMAQTSKRSLFSVSWAIAPCCAKLGARDCQHVTLAQQYSRTPPSSSSHALDGCATRHVRGGRSTLPRVVCARGDRRDAGAGPAGWCDGCCGRRDLRAGDVVAHVDIHGRPLPDACWAGPARSCGGVLCPASATARPFESTAGPEASSQMRRASGCSSCCASHERDLGRGGLRRGV